ncbi:hypothetical protein ColLi_03727 [Colletotrichum liriopes]|uniref:Uncharacterized protein n=1 Tax=Colletotrichum liriopes TaxID=708192 RepID=A0AA37LQ69_9PEZI|nr:hypothetical protein ColLi_03727 [Colletotrichum liriopes]
MTPFNSFNVLSPGHEPDSVLQNDSQHLHLFFVTRPVDHEIRVGNVEPVGEQRASWQREAVALGPALGDCELSIGGGEVHVDGEVAMVVANLTPGRMRSRGRGG